MVFCESARSRSSSSVSCASRVCWNSGVLENVRPCVALTTCRRQAADQQLLAFSKTFSRFKLWHA